MSALRKIKRVGKKATKFHYSATYQSVLIECHSDKWTPHMIQVAWHRRGRRIVSQILPWLPSPDTPLRGMAIWPEPEVVETSITLYKGPKDKSYEHKDWDFSIIDVDKVGQRKVIATVSVDMVRYASALPYEHELQLKLKPVSRKVKKILLELSLSSVFLKEGKATDDDMISLASMMSVSNLSMIGNLEDDEEDFTIRRYNGRSISPEILNAAVPSTDKLIDWAQEVTAGYSGVRILNMTTSWRNGLAFCAIIHYYRPDVLEFSKLSPQSIKENNRLAFDIAQEFGIACPLTPDMMLLRDIPDKLAVTAFVYQMFNFFTKAVHSAIVKPPGTDKESCKPSPSPSPSTGLKPFDFSEIEKLTSKNLSPTVKDDDLASKRNLAGNKWSKHSLREEQESRERNELECNHGDAKGVVHTPDKSKDKNEPVFHSTPVTDCKPTSDNVTTNSDHRCDTKRHKGTPLPFNQEGVAPSDPPKHLPILTGSELSIPLATTVDSSTSVDSKTSTPDTESITNENVPELFKNGFTLGTSGADEEEQKKEYYRKQVKEMMTNAGIKSDIKTFDAFSSKTRKMIQNARRHSHGSTSTASLRTVTSSPSLSAKRLAGQDTPTAEQEPTTKSETQVDSNRHNGTNQSSPQTSRTSQTSLTSSTKSSPNLARELSKDKTTGAWKTNSTNDSPPTWDSPELKKKNSRNRSSSLVILAPEPKRSSIAQKMAEEPPKSETDGSEMGTGETDAAAPRPSDIPQLVAGDSLTSSTTESPSAWISHNNDLAEAILVSTSDYIKNELLLIQKDLRPLEERAVTVEKEIREAMAKGDGKTEEMLTVEYFKLLNEKNALIKKQIELNLLEKEEDLQKTQFFINRELRPLAAIPDDQKTEQQRSREQQLIKELLELMDEREWLDQRLTNTTSSSIAESSTLSPNDNTADVSNHTGTAAPSSSFSASLKSKFTKDRSVSGSHARRGDKDCVIC